MYVTFASCRFGTSWESPPHLFSICLSNHAQRQDKNVKSKGALPTLTLGSQMFIIGTKITLTMKLTQARLDVDGLTYLPI